MHQTWDGRSIMALLATPLRITSMGTSSSTAAQATGRPRATLSAGTVALLRDAVAKYELIGASKAGGTAAAKREQALCDVIDLLCAEAHELGLGPETVVVALKHSYAAVPRRHVDGEPARTRYREVFLRCVRRYFDEGT